MTVSTLSHRGAIATSHHLATEAGADVLRQGGNAIDAALAAAAVLCVVYPNNVALGSDLVAIVRSPDGVVRFLNATGTAAGGETLDALTHRHGAVLPTRGVDTITLPGAIRGWEALHEHGATRAWSEHLEAAIRYACAGVPVARSVAQALIDERTDLERDPGSRALFYPNGSPLQEGDTLVQAALATSLEELALNGPDAFYSGDLAERWITGLRRLGSKLTLDDAQTYRCTWGHPLTSDINGYDVVTGPPNTQGFSLLRALRLVHEHALRAPLADDAGSLAREFHRSNAIRDALLADPECGSLDGQALVSYDGAVDAGSGDGIASGDTVGLSAVSADGWAISLIQSIYHGFGACVLEPETGIIFQNRGTSFSLNPESPNAFAPGKRPRHTLTPVMVLRNGDVAWVPATMGGQAQPQIHTHLLLRALAGEDPTGMTHAPRWVVGRQDTGDTDRTVTVEQGVPQAAIESLRASGFQVKPVDYPDELLGHSNVIAVRGGRYCAASDPRSDGSAVVVS